jgi:hypothetical protein
VTILVGNYTPAKRCSGAATPGAKALMAWYLGAYLNKGAANLGIYVCKDIAGTATTSLHGEGRACDLGSSPYRNLPFMDDVADALVAYSKELGVQCVIHNGKVWSSLYPHDGWRHYGGVDPHRGHIHAELTVASAKSLTVAKINQVLGTTATRPSPPPLPNPADWTGRLIMALPTLKPGMGLKGAISEDVQTMQNLLQARGFGEHLGSGGADGRFGDGSEKALVAFQKACKIKADAVCGKVSWHWLLRQQRLL